MYGPISFYGFIAYYDGPGSSNSSDQNSRLRPSEYLRRRCPLCYGGLYVHDSRAVYVAFFTITRY